ncbi:MAG TPA: histidine kinase dimerization/phospho-acceptor domain-containing protein [Nitrospinota bacterium]|nr:histidine kinase dimerization/phospho-acceptor domain-containing protein [Nitrospinota bacterium]
MKENFLKQDKESIEKERFDAITQIAATINHEINTPLMVVLLNLELLLQKENDLNKKIVNKLKVIQKESQKIKNVTRKLANITINPNIVSYQGNIKMLDIETNPEFKKNNIVFKLLSLFNLKKN